MADIAEVTPQSIERAAEAVLKSNFILIAAGAGFSADSGLPIYKDVAQVKAYQEMGLDYGDLCQPHWRHEDPELFFGFWGSCFNAYEDTEPHRGYKILRDWCKREGVTSYAYTSNVDGHFKRAGFEVGDRDNDELFAVFIQNTAILDPHSEQCYGRMSFTYMASSRHSYVHH